MRDRRLFSRARCSETANLRQGDHVWTCVLIDISLNGVLFNAPEGLSPRSGDQFRLEIPVAAADAVIRADAVVVHVNAGRVGCRFADVDAGSIDQLRDMVLSLFDLDGEQTGV
jgi:c-di-GMP-binding flagellar brake protein YcgR